MLDKYSIDDCLQAIKEKDERNKARIEYLEKENRKIRNEHYKDYLLLEMTKKLNHMEENYYRGFPISEAEDAAIKNWKKNHEETVHGLTTDESKLKAQGSIGGRYTYKFVPTSIGVSGVIQCSCGAEFEFQEI